MTTKMHQLLAVSLFIVSMSSTLPVRAQDQVEEEFDAIEEPVSKTPEMAPAEIPQSGSQLPKGPPGGGVIKAEHPDASRGLLRIDKEGTYYYKTPTLEKSQSASFRLGYQNSPVIVSKNGVKFVDIYGRNLFGLVGEYEWQAFRRFGSFGLQLGGGLTVARGNGRFADGQSAEEIYNFIILPLSANVVYRFEYMKNQWLVPFVSGGVTVYGLVEMRDDGKTPSLAWSPAAGGGGGVHISISAWDRQSAFILAQEYGVSDLWLTVEGKVVQGLRSDLDFSNQMVSAGFTVDF